jgi:hypothetical protein
MFFDSIISSADLKGRASNSYHKDLHVLALKWAISEPGTHISLEVMASRRLKKSSRLNFRIFLHLFLLDFSSILHKYMMLLMTNNITEYLRAYITKIT